MCNPIKIFFDQLASEWDGMYPPVSGETLDAILDALHIFPGCQVLDVGCGTGVLFQKLLAKGAGNRNRSFAANARKGASKIS